MLDILKQINWIDIFVIILLVRVCLVAANTGFPVEIFKFLGTLACIYLAMHYYSGLGKYAQEAGGLKEQPLGLLNFLSFIALACIGYFAFVILRRVFFKFVKMEAISTLNKWGGLVLGIARGLLLTSLIIFTLFISGLNYFRSSIAGSLSGKKISEIAPSAYAYLWDNLLSKFMSQEKFNKNIHDVQKQIQQAK